MSSVAPRPSTLRSLWLALTSWRTASVTLLSFSSGLPLGLVWIAIPDWMRSVGVDIRIVGMITLAQAPWTFKFLWSPLMDRYAPPFWGRRRGWTIIAQAALFATTAMLALVKSDPEAAWIVAALALAIGFSAATQDIAIDAYAVEVLRKDEQGIAVGARVAIYRAAMFVAGGASITLAGQYGWRVVAILLATIYLPLMLVTRFAPEPEEKIASPKSLRDAVWFPFLGFLARHRALEILAFVVLYKLADNLSGSLLRPFLVDMKYDDFHRGVALATIALVGTISGTIIGGVATNWMGLGRALWVFGVLQMASNLGYVVLARLPEPSIPIMYGAMGFEQVTQGLGTGAFSVLLLRLTQRRFSATQYALFSSLFGIPRVAAGPISGFLVYSIGWEWFFWLTIFAGIPGLILLARFVPISVKDPQFTIRTEAEQKKPVTRAVMWGSAAISTLAGAAFGYATVALMAALRAFKKEAPPDLGIGDAFAWIANDLPRAFGKVLSPATVPEWVTLAGIAIFGLLIGMFTAAILAARSTKIPDET